MTVRTACQITPVGDGTFSVEAYVDDADAKTIVKCLMREAPRLTYCVPDGRWYVEIQGFPMHLVCDRVMILRNRLPEGKKKERREMIHISILERDGAYTVKEYADFRLVCTMRLGAEEPRVLCDPMSGTRLVCANGTTLRGDVVLRNGQEVGE